MANILRCRLQRGDFLLGSHINGNDPTMTECMGLMGVDYLWIDTEHTAIDYQALQLHLIAAKASGCPAMVRVPWNEGYLAKRVLEMGPDAVVFPMIRSVEEARKAIASCQYPPRGDRSYGPVRAAGYGAVSPRAFAEEVEPPCCFLQVEHVDAIGVIDELLELPGLDGIIFGACDLSASMGRLGYLDDPELRQNIDYVIAKCKAKGMPAGLSTGLTSEAVLRDWRDRGLQFMSVGNEYAFIQSGLGALKKVFG